MSSFILMISTLIITSVIYIIFLIRDSAKKEKFIGHRLMIGIIFWLLSTTTIVYFSPTLVALTIIVDAFKHSMILMFLYHFISLKENDIKWLKPALNGLPLALATTIFMPFWGINSIGAYSFFGVVIILFQFLLTERLYKISKINNKNYHSLVFVIGAISLLDLAIYCEISISQLINVHQFEWRTVLILTLLPFLWKGMNALQNTTIKFHISKPLAFNGILFLMSGTYLLGISIIGYFIQLFEINFNHTTQLVLSGFAIVPLIFALSSSRLRKEVIVRVNKNLFSAQFDYRKTWLTLIEKLNPDLSGNVSDEYALRTILDSIKHDSGAYFDVNDSGEIKQLASLNINLTAETENTLLLMLDYLRETNWIVDIPEAHHNKNKYPNLDICLATLDNNVRWVVPISREQNIKGLLIIGKTAHKDWDLNWETRDFLLALGHQLERYIFSQNTQRKLSENAQLTAFHQTSAFVVHDLKNVHQQMKMLKNNGEQHRHNPEFIDDLFVTLNSMETRVNKILTQLTSKQDKKVHNLSKIVDINLFLNELVLSKELILAGPPPIFFTADNNKNAKVNVDTYRFTNVLSHLIDNARYACKNSKHPEVGIHCQATDKYVKITISDNGIGMSEDFITSKLFHPFETTKGNSGMGLGVYDAKIFAENHGGNISVISDVGHGSQFTISLPRSGI